jgi:hypothetical protein
MLCEEHDLGPRIRLNDLSSCKNSIQEGHGDVENGDLRMVLLTELHGLAAIGGFRDKLKPFFFQKNAQSLAEHFVIVRD